MSSEGAIDRGSYVGNGVDVSCQRQVIPKSCWVPSHLPWSRILPFYFSPGIKPMTALYLQHWFPWSVLHRAGIVILQKCKSWSSDSCFNDFRVLSGLNLVPLYCHPPSKKKKTCLIWTLLPLSLNPHLQPHPPVFLPSSLMTVILNLEPGMGIIACISFLLLLSKLPQIHCFKARKMYSLILVEARSPNWVLTG